MKGIHQRILSSAGPYHSNFRRRGSSIYFTGLVSCGREASASGCSGQSGKIMADGVRTLYGSLADSGDAGKSIVAGWFFGVVGGVLMVDLALTAAAMITFFASRFIFRESVEARFGVHLVQFRRRVDAQPGFYLLSLRLHTPFSFLNYAAGATGIVPPPYFLVDDAIGTPAEYNHTGLRGDPDSALSVIADKGPLALLDGTLFAGLLATAALPVILRMVVCPFNEICSS